MGKPIAVPLSKPGQGAPRISISRGRIVKVRPVSQRLDRLCGDGACEARCDCANGRGLEDLGSWSSVWDIGDKTMQAMCLVVTSLLKAQSTHLIKAEHRLVGVAGVSGLTIVETADSVLVADREASQSIKALVAKLEASGREESVTHRRIYRPWGWYESVDRGDRHQVSGF